ncbi:non-specific protein-tyrosine kinase [Ranunculus cassubicifolius]
MAFSAFALFSTLVLVLQFNPTTAQTRLQQFCYESYSANSQYDTNLDILLSSISNNTTGNNARFYNNTVGTLPDRIFGVFQCRGDVKPEECNRCAREATSGIKRVCPNNKEITIFYDECWLRYNNKIIISTMIGDPKWSSRGKNVSNPDQFRDNLNELMLGLVAKAISNSSADVLYYASGEKKVTDSQTIYGLVQCSQDISRRDCGRCLAKSINQIPPNFDAKDSGRLFKPSCIIQFDVSRFYAIPTIPLFTRQDESSDTVIKVVVPTVSVVSFISIVAVFLYIRRKKKREMAMNLDDIPTVESLQFNFGIVTTATDNFNDANKLGEGGFGAVYKGTLLDGRKIAVKRLSKNSGQGIQEFKNEVLLLAKLQHRNLVRLLGFCLEGREKLLIYEYVPNASLDMFIFGPIKRSNLDWATRYNIIQGIARGLLYLHEDSPDRIIHRDLKAGNILLDSQMNPKIADFGLARLFVVDQIEGNTNKIVGTYGYMPPEYLLQGHFSVKLDVFSFGVLVLEIITGQRNSSFYSTDGDQDLLSYAWRQWEEENAMELVDPTMREEYSTDEVMKCIQMAMLCVQKEVEKRPTMASVVLMLNNHFFELPTPTAPAFFADSAIGLDMIRMEDGAYTADRIQVVDQSINGSVDDVSITELYPR